jgi:hypothetical protein
MVLLHNGTPTNSANIMREGSSSLTMGPGESYDMAVCVHAEAPAQRGGLGTHMAIPAPLTELISLAGELNDVLSKSR